MFTRLIEFIELLSDTDTGNGDYGQGIAGFTAQKLSYFDNITSDSNPGYSNHNTVIFKILLSILKISSRANHPGS